MAAPQTYQNHAKFDPVFHFFLAPLFLLNFVFSFVLDHNHRHQHPHIAAWWVILSLGLLVLVFKIRVYSLRVQDRVIRLEERLRLSALLPPTEHASIQVLTLGQLIALRFASDEEISVLVRRTLAEQLEPKQIKQAITAWRTDNYRV